MKKIILWTMMMILASQSFSQSINNPVRADYLKKCKKKKTTAHIMLWSGIVISFAGNLISEHDNYDHRSTGWGPFSGETVVRNSNAYNNTGDIIQYTGLASIAGSIPFFVAARSNKKKAMSLSFKKETVPLIWKQCFVSKSFPSVSIKMSF